MASYQTPINQRYARFSSNLQTTKTDIISAFSSPNHVSVTDGRLHRKLEIKSRMATDDKSEKI
jgi:hypothetical protein